MFDKTAVKSLCLKYQYICIIKVIFKAELKTSKLKRQFLKLCCIYLIIFNTEKGFNYTIIYVNIF